MTIDTNGLLRAVEQTLDEVTASKAATLLFDPEAHLVDGAPTHEEVRKLLPTLRARLTNSARTGKRIFGLEQSVTRLAKMDPMALVIGYGYISPRMAGNVYVSDQGNEVLGATIVDR
jgi:hypothetical protein